MTFTGSVYDGKADDASVLYCHADGKTVTLGDFRRALHAKRSQEKM